MLDALDLHPILPRLSCPWRLTRGTIPATLLQMTETPRYRVVAGSGPASNGGSNRDGL
jgi:hypothetical protein